MAQRDIASLLEYDPETGLIRWRVKPCKNRKIGDTAGSINGDGYRHIQVDGVSLKAHRVAWLLMTGAWPDLQIDHKNGDRADNRWNNLRLATVAQNSANKVVSNKTGLRGVVKRGTRYYAQLKSNYKATYLGSFDTAADAHEAWLNAAKKAHLDFVRE